jgi:hypothetical protein
MKYFDEGQLKDMLIKATEEAITNFSKGYKWYKTPQPDDDYIFDTPQESETVGFLFQAREEGIGYSINTSTDSKGSIEKLVITFNEFEFDEDMKDELKV